MNISVFKRFRLTYPDGPEDSRSRRSTQVGQVGGTRKRWVALWENPPGSDRDLFTCQGQKRGVKHTQETAEEEGMWRRAQIRAAEAGRWQVWGMSRWMAISDGRGGGGKVKQREVI